MDQSYVCCLCLCQLMWGWPEYLYGASYAGVCCGEYLIVERDFLLYSPCYLRVYWCTASPKFSDSCVYCTTSYRHIEPNTRVRVLYDMGGQIGMDNLPCKRLSLPVLSFHVLYQGIVTSGAYQPWNSRNICLLITKVSVLGVEHRCAPEPPPFLLLSIS